MAQALTEIFATVLDSVALIKDGGADLGKGVALWKANEGKKAVWTMEDIGHVMANALKAQFEKTKAFERFVSVVHKAGARLRQTKLAFLIPPKLRTKGRFQGISRLGEWAERMLDALAGRGRAEEHSALAKLRTAMAGFAPLRPFIERSPQADMNRTTLVIPALCGMIDGPAIAQALAHTTHGDIQRWEQENIPYTVRQQRRTFFNVKGHQIPGKLECH